MRPLPGIQNPAPRTAFIEQVLESIHRIQYFPAIRARAISPLRIDPSNDLFDPLKGALLMHQQGKVDEAFWLAFLAVHFGKHLNAGWLTTRQVYGQLGNGNLWDWNTTSQNPVGFRNWLSANHQNIVRRVGNHRKYLSLNANSPTGTGAAIESYVNWVGPARSHHALIQDAHVNVGQNPRATFEYLYNSMDAVASYGRLGKFDFLTMVAKLGLAPIEPGSTYMHGATGPVPGAKLLFGGSTTANLNLTDLDEWLIDLEAYLNQPLGMQVLEDSLCNWQKSPNQFVAFRG